jgi:spore germination protein GerM
MKGRLLVTIGGGLLLLAILAWGVTRGLERLVEPGPTTPMSATSPEEPPADVPRITATLFYASADGRALVPVRREVALADGVVQQGLEILAAQLQGAPPPYLSVIPPGTTLRAFFVTGRADAFVDLSGDVSAQHPGGSFAEMLTVYAIVNTITGNLPGVQRVQILIDGSEADTLAGHVDLRRPLEQDLSFVREEGAIQ